MPVRNAETLHTFYYLGCTVTFPFPPFLSVSWSSHLLFPLGFLITSWVGFFVCLPKTKEFRNHRFASLISPAWLAVWILPLLPGPGPGGRAIVEASVPPYPPLFPPPLPPPPLRTVPARVPVVGGR